MHQQQVPVVYVDHQLGDYPLGLSHLYCCTSGKRKIDDIVGESVADTLSLSLSLFLTHMHAHTYTRLLKEKRACN